MTSSTTLGEGTSLGEYILVAKLGEGPFSEVWEAHHEDDDEDGERYALKVATHPLYTQWMAEHETFALDADHENLLLANEIDFSQIPPYLVYDLIPGDNLAELVEAGLQFDQRGIVAIMRQVAAGVAALHQVGEFHGCLKPKNVQIADSGEVLVLDTETARITRDITLFVRRSQDNPQFKSLLPYLAPEEVKQPGRTDLRCDVYSLGMLYYLLLRMRTPPGRALKARDLRDAPDVVVDLVLDCVAELDYRLASAMVFLERLEEIVDDLPEEEEEEDDDDDDEWEVDDDDDDDDDWEVDDDDDDDDEYEDDD